MAGGSSQVAPVRDWSRATRSLAFSNVSRRRGCGEERQLLAANCLAVRKESMNELKLSVNSVLTWVFCVRREESSCAI